MDCIWYRNIIQVLLIERCLTFFFWSVEHRIIEAAAHTYKGMSKELCDV